MVAIQWSDQYSVSIAEIDKQHKFLIDLVNDLSNAMHEGKGNDILGEILSDLIRYTDIHFKTEEKYFDQYGYPDKLKHKQEHTELIAKVLDFKQKFDSNRAGLTLPVMSFLVDWLKTHIVGSDKKYTAFLNSKGLK